MLRMIKDHNGRLDADSSETAPQRDTLAGKLREAVSRFEV